MNVTTVLSIQSFLKVVVGKEFPLGVYEYRLHVIAFLPGLLIFGTANANQGMGPFLYFQGPNLATGSPGRGYGWFSVLFFLFVSATVMVTSYMTVRHVNRVRNEMHGKKQSAAQSKATAGTDRAVRRLQSFTIAACLQWLPCALLLTAAMADTTKPYGFRMFCIYVGIAGANLGGVWNSVAYIYNERIYMNMRAAPINGSGVNQSTSAVDNSTTGKNSMKGQSQTVLPKLPPGQPMTDNFFKGPVTAMA
ncbi:uncharacterized protein EV422DRAFT_366496 [Fimicolochytrium jonesii]|uniref:uncharacterized protein n=1 Tax=Fimicolochytrium jonesii TaxID=1396493 RepID=UPI0022FE4747|nr:uncharacterized protein EV422DRAFT_366496 [Fimicolochytrium jonesii]KAI8823697.1 hypothetical protein EV422DRAFT_366496 [Fimicolochytrium jonesii]